MKKKQLSRKYPKSKNTSFFKSKLGILLTALAIFLGGSVYMAINSGTGPFSFLSQKSDINFISTGDPVEDCFLQRGTWKDGECLNKNPYTPKPATPKPATPRPATPRPNNPIPDGGIPTPRPAGSTATPKPAGSTATPKPAAPKTCNVNSGVNVEAGKYVASGGGLESDGKTTCTSSSNCPYRKCVQIKDDCSHGPVVKCNEVYNANPSNVILPVGAGSEYTAGKTPAQIKAEKAAAEAKGETPPSAPIAKNQCYDKNSAGVWVIVTDGTPSDGKPGQICENGHFIAEAAYLANRKKDCESAGTHLWDATGKKCNPKPSTPTDAEKKAKAEQCRAENKSYDSDKNACGGSLKCGPGYTERAGYCDLAVGATSEIVRENIISSGETFCKSKGKVFDKNTGLCVANEASVTAGRPVSCTEGLSNGNKTKTECKKDSTGKVTGSTISYCSVGFTSAGTCPSSTTPLITAVPNQPGTSSTAYEYQDGLRKVSKATDCDPNTEKSRVIRGPEGGIFCEKLAPTTTQTVDPNLRKVEKATDCRADEKSRVIRGPEGGIFCEKVSTAAPVTSTPTNPAANASGPETRVIPTGPCPLTGSARCAIVCGGLNNYTVKEGISTYGTCNNGGQIVPVNPASTAESDTRPDPTKVTYENGKVGVYARDPSECKYGHGAVKPEGSSMYICPNEGGLSTPALNLQVNAVADNATTAKPKKVGETCVESANSPDSCRACPNLGQFITVRNTGSANSYYTVCGSPTNTVLTGEIVRNSDDIYTLKLGDVCDNSLLSNNKCSKCPAGTYSVIWIGERVLKVCGSSTVADQIDLVSAQDAIKTQDGNNTRNILVSAGTTAVAAGTTCAIYGAALGFGVFSAPVALAGGVVCGVGGAIVGAIAGGTVGPNNVNVNLLP